MAWKNVSEVETKEEKTQAQMLKEDLFPELYGKLNLSQFVNPDQTVRIDELGKHLGKLGFSEGVIEKVKNYLEKKTANREEVRSQLTLEYEQIQTIDKGLTDLGITVKGQQRTELILQILSHEVNISDSAHLTIWIIVGKGEGFGNEENIEIELTDEMEKAVYIRNHSEEIVRFKENSNSVKEFDEQLLPELKDDVLLHQWFVASKTYEFIMKRDFARAKMLREEGKGWAKGHKYDPSEFMKGVYEQFKLLGGTDMEWLSASLGFDVSRIKEANELNELLRSASKTLEPDYLFVYIETVLKPLFGGTEEMQVGEAEVKRLDEIKNVIQKLSEEDRKILLKLIRARINELDERIKKVVRKEDKEKIESTIKYLEKQYLEKLKKIIEHPK